MVRNAVAGLTSRSENAMSQPRVAFSQGGFVGRRADQLGDGG